MHELSIAQAIVAIAARHADGRRVTQVELKLGQLRQVVPAPLEFSFELVAQGTELEGARLVIEEVAVGVLCRSCGARSAPDGFPLLCEACGELDVEVVAGEELLVDALEFEERLTTNAIGGQDDGR